VQSPAALAAGQSVRIWRAAWRGPRRVRAIIERRRRRGCRRGTAADRQEWEARSPSCSSTGWRRRRRSTPGAARSTRRLWPVWPPTQRRRYAAAARRGGPDGERSHLPPTCESGSRAVSAPTSSRSARSDAAGGGGDRLRASRSWFDPLSQRRGRQRLLMTLAFSRHVFVNPVLICDERSWWHHIAASILRRCATRRSSG